MRTSSVFRRRPLLLAALVLALIAFPSGHPALAAFAGWLRWPLGGSPVVTRGFDLPEQPWLPGHRGVDLAARPGGIVRAAGPGVVVFAGDLAGRGVVSVAHPGGIRTTYEPLSPLVAVGDEVAAGTPLGTLAAGHQGCPVDACLHWGARRDDTYLNPLALLGPPRLRLKPLTG